MSRVAEANINVNVSRRAKDGWEKYAREAGVSVTALVEAIGLDMLENKPTKRGEMLFKRAREITWERSRRPK